MATIINGEYASWSSLGLRMQREDMKYLTEDYTELEFEDSVDGEKIRNKKRVPVGYTIGDYDSNASITLRVGAFYSLQQELAAKDSQGRIARVKFDLKCRWRVEDEDNGLVVDHDALLPGCRIVGRGFSGSEGSADASQITVPLMVTGVIEMDGVKLI